MFHVKHFFYAPLYEGGGGVAAGGVLENGSASVALMFCDIAPLHEGGGGAAAGGSIGIATASLPSPLRAKQSSGLFRGPPKPPFLCLPLWGRWQPEGLTDEVL